jgi:two-component system CitB family sensor kinase
VVAAVSIANYFKRSIFGLEPEQIAQLFKERNATLESVREGIIALNADGRITTFNKAAVDTLGLQDDMPLAGKHISEVLPNNTMLETLDSRQPLYDQEIRHYGQPIVVNRIPVFDDDQVTGVVSSFRRKDELDRLARQLSRSEQYADTLRSQAHEYSNKLQTIAGLIEIGAHDEALEFVGRESRDHQSLIHLLAETIREPTLSGCLLGKFNRAHELGIELVLDPESRLQALPDHIAADQLVTIVGNLLDNAFDATVMAKGRKVTLSISDYGADLIFEVEDQGVGIDAAHEASIFDKGFSTKQDEGRGWGLYLASQMARQLQGGIQLEHPKGGGARLIAYLPKEVKPQ